MLLYDENKEDHDLPNLRFLVARSGRAIKENEGEYLGSMENWKDNFALKKRWDRMWLIFM